MYVRGMTEKKEVHRDSAASKVERKPWNQRWWFMGLMILLLLAGVDSVLYEEGWDRWKGVLYLVVSVSYWVEYFWKRKKDSST